MANQVLQGKLIGVSVDGEFPDCQTDATLTLTVNTEETDPCKPAPGESSSSADWVKPTVSSKTGTLDFSAKAWASSSGYNQSDIAEKIINGDAKVEWQFMTIQTTDFNENHEEAWVFSGDGILTSLAITGAAAGEATYDTSILLYDKPTLVRTPITT